MRFGFLSCFFLACLVLLSGCHFFKPTPQKKAQILRTCLEVDVVSLDPRKGSVMGSQAVHRMLFMGLVRLDDNLTSQLELAESYEVSPDFKTYIFTLKKCSWSDGSPITAYDFEESWKAALTPAFASFNSTLLFCIKNGEKACLDPSFIDQLGVQALDDRTLKVELEKPNAHFLNILINCNFSPVHKSMWHSSPNEQNLICSGPFRLKKHLHQNQIILERNNHYWNRDQVQLDEIHYYIIEDVTTAILMFEKGQLDWLGSPLITVPIDAIPDLRKKGTLSHRQAAGSQWLFLKTDKFPLNNAHIRRALGLAIDRQKIQHDIMHLEEVILPMWLIPKIIKGDRWRSQEPESAAYEVQSLFAQGLEELGISREQFPPLKITCSAAKSSRTIALAVQQMWKNSFGIEVTVEILEGNGFFTKYAEENFDVVTMGYVMQYNDPASFLNVFRKVNGLNHTGWINAEFNRHVDSYSSISDNEKRWESIEAAEKIFLEEMPSIPVSPTVACYLSQPHIKHLSPNPLLLVDFDRAIIDSESSSK